jgi:hypothetical protein
MATQRDVAAWFKAHGFPFATARGAGEAGTDVFNMLGLACEVKARKGFSPLAWVKQAVANADGDLPFVLMRLDGQGPASVADWPVVMRTEDFTRLIRAAGYGDPE